MLNRFFDEARIAFQCVVTDSDDFDSYRSQSRRPFAIVSRHVHHPVMPAIDFDCESEVRTVEVEDVAVNRMLSSELEAEKTPVAQPLPKPALGSGLVVSHCSRVGKQSLRCPHAYKVPRSIDRSTLGRRPHPPL